MNGFLWAAAGTGFTFTMTMLGAAVVFFFRSSDVNENFRKVFSGFAAGVMIAASVWSLLIPSIEETENSGGIGWLPAAGGFIFGAVFLVSVDKLLSHLQIKRGASLKENSLLIFAITLHNIPEGMAVGVAINKKWIHRR